MTERDINLDTVDCVVCKERYDPKVRVPKRLSCSHTICVLCMPQLVEKSRLRCPVCRSEQSFSRENKLPTDLPALQAVKIIQLIVCGDCGKVKTDVTKCSNCSKRSCDKCMKYHKTATHCEIVNRLHEISKIADEAKVNQAKKIKERLRGGKRGLPKLRGDVEAKFESLNGKVNEQKIKVLDQVSTLEKKMNSVEAVLMSAKSIQRTRSAMNHDVDVQALKLKVDQLLSLVKVNLDDFDTDASSTALDMDKIVAAVKELSIGNFRDIGTKKRKGLCEVSIPELETRYSEVSANYWYRGASPRLLVPSWFYISDLTILPTDGTICLISGTKHGLLGMINPDTGQADRRLNLQGVRKVCHLAAISDQTVAVSIQDLNVVRIFDLEKGDMIREFGSQGKGGQQFSGPSGICHSEGLLYIADYRNNRVCVWDVEGLFMTHLKHKKLRKPLKVAISSRQELAVLTTYYNEVMIFDADGDYKTTVGDLVHYLPSEPVLCFDSNNNLIVAGMESVYDNPNVHVDVFDDEYVHAIKLEIKREGVDPGVTAVAMDRNGDIVLAMGDQGTGSVLLL